MKILAVLLLIGCALEVEGNDRFALETYPVSVTRLVGSNEVVEPVEALFKLDTELASVWRFETNTFIRIVVRDLVSQKAFTELKGRQLLKRLETITIPRIDFQRETISNAVAFLRKQIKDLDPTIQRDSNEFLRIEYVTEGAPSTDEGTLVTFNATRISALETLKIISNVANLQYRVEDDHIVLCPLFCEEGRVIHRTYKVSPSLRGRLDNASLSNTLARLGFDLKPWTNVTYIPEFDLIIAGATTYSGHERLLWLFQEADFLPHETGRFRLVSMRDGGRVLLFLLDDQTGEMWLYRATIGKDGLRKESFDRILTRWYPEREDGDKPLDK